MESKIISEDQTMTVQTTPTTSYTPTITLVFANPELTIPDETTIAERIAALENSLQPDAVEVHWEACGSDKCLGSILFQDHEVHISGLSTPLPPAILDQTVHVSRWQPQIKAAIRQHRTQINLVYTGHNPDPINKMVALYQIAYAFSTEDLLGVINPNAWTAHPPADFLTKELIRTFCNDIPFNLWIGYVKFFIDKQRYWLASKGHHIFDVPDLAYQAEPGEDIDEIVNHFINIFYYFYEQDVEVLTGDTLAIQGTSMNFQFSEVEEGAEFLMGPSGTLVIEKVDRE